MSAEVILSAVGIIIGLAFLILGAQKGLAPIFLAPVAACIIALFSGLGLSTFVVEYGTGFSNTVKGLFMNFLAAMIFAELMKSGGGATSIAYCIADHIGPKFAATVGILASTILTIGGMSVSAYFCVYPIGVVLCSKANYSRDLMAAAVFCGPFNFAVMAPFVPSVHNGLLTTYLGVDGRVGGIVPGLIVSVCVLFANIIFLEWTARRWQKKGRGFTDWDLVPEDNEETRKNLPPAWRAFLPLVVVLVLFNVVKLDLFSSLMIGSAVITVCEWKKWSQLDELNVNRENLDILLTHVEFEFPSGVQCKIKGLAACVTQTASPLGCLNNLS